jgi:hypothetical protein
MATSAYQGAGQPLYRAQTVELRQEREPLAGGLLLMRWVIADVKRVLDTALNYRLLYASVMSELDLPGDGAWVLSTFALRDGWTPQRLAEGTHRNQYQTNLWCPSWTTRERLRRAWTAPATSSGVS